MASVLGACLPSGLPSGLPSALQSAQQIGPLKTCSGFAILTGWAPGWRRFGSVLERAWGVGAAGRFAMEFGI